MEYPNCLKCGGVNTYMLEEKYICPDCFHEWNVGEPEPPEEPYGLVVLDANGNQLQDGDSVVTIKNLPVKGASKPIKAGTKVKRIRLTDGDHNIDCKIEGFGAVGLKSEFVKKA